MADRPSVLGVATYRDVESAVADFTEMHPSDQVDERPVAAALVVKGPDGKLRIDRYDTSTLRPWGGALLGGALAVVAAPLAIQPLSDVATKDGTWAGVGGIVGHFWHHIAKRQLLRMSELLESGQAALVVVAIDRTAPDVDAMLLNSTETIVAETDGGDLEQAYLEALAQERQSS